MVSCGPRTHLDHRERVTVKGDTVGVLHKQQRHQPPKHASGKPDHELFEQQNASSETGHSGQGGRFCVSHVSSELVGEGLAFRFVFVVGENALVVQRLQST